MENSEFLSWFHTESMDIFDPDRVGHYAVVTESALWVDVLSILEPSIDPLSLT